MPDKDVDKFLEREHVDDHRYDFIDVFDKIVKTSMQEKKTTTDKKGLSSFYKKS